MDSNSITEGAPFGDSVAVQTTMRTPRRSDRRTTTMNITPQSPEATRRRVGTPSGTNMEAPQNLAANLEAATGLAAGAANPASGLSQGPPSGRFRDRRMVVCRTRGRMVSRRCIATTACTVHVWRRTRPLLSQASPRHR